MIWQGTLCSERQGEKGQESECKLLLPHQVARLDFTYCDKDLNSILGKRIKLR